MKVLEEYAAIRKDLDSAAQIWIKPTVEEALQLATSFADLEHGPQAFVTGHDRLIGPAICILEPTLRTE